MAFPLTLLYLISKFAILISRAGIKYYCFSFLLWSADYNNISILMEKKKLHDRIETKEGTRLHKKIRKRVEARNGFRA